MWIKVSIHLIHLKLPQISQTYLKILDQSEAILSGSNEQILLSPKNHTVLSMICIRLDFKQKL